MEKGVVVDIGNDIEGFVPLSHLPSEKAIESPADVVWDGMNLDLRVVEVDPIHRRIVLTVTDIPAEQPPKPETIKIHSEDDTPPEIPADLSSAVED
jgi:small subunit ribosomal protein S1